MSALNPAGRMFCLALIASAVIALGTAYTAQYVFGYEPCVLCVYQRVPYGIVGMIGLIGLLWCGPEKMPLIALIAGLVFLIGAGSAFYHVGVEQKWWISVAPCGGGVGDIVNTDDLLAALRQPSAKSCGDIEWALFGISMATYNAVVSLVLAGGALSIWHCIRGRVQT